MQANLAQRAALFDRSFLLAFSLPPRRWIVLRRLAPPFCRRPQLSSSHEWLLEFLGTLK
jgi:hypothetical protein